MTSKAETSNQYKPPQNPPNPAELAQGLSEHLSVVLPAMTAEARENGDLARIFGLGIAGRFSDVPASLEWFFEGDEETRLITDDFTRHYLESGLDPEGNQHDADIAIGLYADAEALEPKMGYSRAAIQADTDERGMKHTRVVAITGQGDAQRISYLEPESPCVRLAIKDLRKEWTGSEDGLYEDGVIVGYLNDDYIESDGSLKSDTFQDTDGIHYQGDNPEEYVNFALNGGFLNEYPIEVPPELLS
jgi:hypothetical protein